MHSVHCSMGSAPVHVGV